MAASMSNAARSREASSSYSTSALASLQLRDFGRADPQRWLRLSFASSMENLEEALHRLRRELQRG